MAFLTGMALPCILFPSAITNSVSINADADSCRASRSKTRHPRQKTAAKSTWLLFFSWDCSAVCFSVLRTVDRSIFGLPVIGPAILLSHWRSCPFLYVNGSLGECPETDFGKTTTSFYMSTWSFGLAHPRIGSVFFAIPIFGIQGLWAY